ncbi:hypothetical protein [Roseibium polysiphoniae]|uniref:hypothetical protein n=1 Tax=Roseibium polysiphoniae TaxID=2571221 RepID=UPI00329985A9
MRAFTWSEILEKYDQRIFRSGFVVTSFIGFLAVLLRNLVQIEFPGVGEINFSFTPKVGFVVVLVYVLLVIHQVIHVVLEYFLCPEQIYSNKNKASYITTQTILITHPRLLENFRDELFSGAAGYELSTAYDEDLKSKMIGAYKNAFEQYLSAHKFRDKNKNSKSLSFDPIRRWDELELEAPRQRAALTIFYWFAFLVLFFGLYIIFPLSAMAFLGVF